MSAKSTYKSRMKSDKKRRQRQARERAAAQGQWIDLNMDQWAALVVEAVGRDDVDALRMLGQEARWSIWQIRSTIVINDVQTIEKAPLTLVAVHIGAVQCAAALAEMAARDREVSAIDAAAQEACERFERGGEEHDFDQQMLSAIILGAAKGFGGPTPGCYLWLDPACPRAMRHAMLLMENEPCEAAEAAKPMRAHVESRRKLLGSIARSDSDAIEGRLRLMSENLKAHGDKGIAQSEVELFLRSAMCCGEFLCLVKLFTALFDLATNFEAVCELMSAALAYGEALGSSGACANEEMLREAIARCVGYLVAMTGRSEAGIVFVDRVAPKLSFLKDAVEGGVARGVAIIEKAEMELELGGQSPQPIHAASTALRI